MAFTIHMPGRAGHIDYEDAIGECRIYVEMILGDSPYGLQPGDVVDRRTGKPVDAERAKTILALVNDGMTACAEKGLDLTPADPHWMEAWLEEFKRAQPGRTVTITTAAEIEALRGEVEGGDR